MTVVLRRSWARDLDARTLYELLRLRAEVFVVEQSCPYLDPDGADLLAATRHYWLERPDGTVIATLRMLQDEDFRIGRVCTDPSERGNGYATVLMEAALSDVGGQPCRISAQTYLAEMYGSLGFVQDGDEFLEDGIPHVPMLRPAAAGAFHP